MKKLTVISFILFIISISVINCSEDEAVKPELDDERPEVLIASPSDGAAFTAGDTINFVGSGLDYERTVLPDSMLVWTSDKDDTLGTGASLVRDDLSVNTHHITLSGTDSDGRTGSETITITVNRDFDRLITVPGTSGYLMGWGGISDAEVPQHSVALDHFAIGKYEVTYELWSEVREWAVSTGGYTFSNYGNQGGCYPPPCGDTDQHPVTEISWRDCIAWCNAYSEMRGFDPAYYTGPDQTEVYRSSLPGSDIDSDCVDWSADGFRLPTEAEWEYAARYIDGSLISMGSRHSGYNIYPNIDNCAWYYQNSMSGTHETGELNPNNLEIHDMSGNVWELCWDWFGDYPDIAVENPHGPTEGTDRIKRGGSWNGYASWCQTAYRNKINPIGSFYDTGFRVCRSGQEIR